MWQCLAPASEYGVERAYVTFQRSAQLRSWRPALGRHRCRCHLNWMWLAILIAVGHLLANNGPDIAGAHRPIHDAVDQRSTFCLRRELGDLTRDTNGIRPLLDHVLD